MAKIVIAGKADCAYYAKIEILADSLVKNLPKFQVHKIVKQPQDWEAWMTQTCRERGWSTAHCPLVWRELVDRGGKGVLIGGANEFQEYCYSYYGIKSDFTSEDMRKIAQENMATKQQMDKDVAEQRAQSKPLHVCVTQASSRVAYAMLDGLARGDALGPHAEVSLRLLDEEDKMEAMAGLEMEVVDLARGLLRSVCVTSDPKVAFKDCSVVIFLDHLVQTEEETEEDWLRRNNQLFAHYGQCLNAVARPDVRVLVAGNGPVNFNATMLIENTPAISNKNVVAVSRTVENQAKAVIGQRLGVNAAAVVDTIIWGNVNGTNIADVSKARVHGYEGAITGPPSYSVPAVDMVHDDKWLATEFVEMLQRRRDVTEEALGRPSAIAQAAAVVSLLHDWWSGTPEGQIFSLGVYSEGHYGVPVGFVFSFPVKIDQEGSWHIVEGLELDNSLKDKMTNIANELLLEKEVIYPDPNKPIVTITAAPTPVLPEDGDDNRKVFGQVQTEEKMDTEKTETDKPERPETGNQETSEADKSEPTT